MPVSSTSTRKPFPSPSARNTTRPADVCFAAFSPRLRSACSSRSRFTLAARPSGHSTSMRTPARGRRSSATSCSNVARSTGSACGVRGPVRLRECGARIDQPLRELAEREAVPRIRQGVALVQPAEEPAGLRVREVHDELVVHGQDALVQALEQDAQPVALTLYM